MCNDTQLLTFTAALIAVSKDAVGVLYASCSCRLFSRQSGSAVCGLAALVPPAPLPPCPIYRVHVVTCVCSPPRGCGTHWCVPTRAALEEAAAQALKTYACSRRLVAIL